MIIGINIAGTVFARNLKGKNFKSSKNPLKFFSIERNVKRLFTVKTDTYDASSNLNVFSGIRVICMFGVTYGHTYAWHYEMPENKNVLPLIIKTKTMLWAENANFGVDTFFLLGGFFSAFVLLKKL